ncbi:MAG: FxLYD domain-containing protein [Methanoregula sp.]
MTDAPVLLPAAPAKKPGNPHTLIMIFLVALIIAIAVLLILSGPVFNGPVGSNAQNAPAVVPVAGVPAMIPAQAMLPAAEIVSKSVTCQVTGLLEMTGTVKNNVAHPLSVSVRGTGYDSNGNEMGTGYDSVDIDPYGTGTYRINVIDGCQLGDSGTYDVRISQITWRYAG